MTDEEKKAPNPWLKLAIEAGPLVAFFVANSRFGIIKATGVFMVAIVLSLAASWRMERKLPVMPLITAFFVLVFGGLTIALNNDLFIKLKPTIVNVLFAAILFGGLAFKRALLKPVMQSALKLEDEGWRILTLRWACYFVVLAVLNEIARRQLTTDQWVTFKTFGVMTLTFVFMLAQMRLLERYSSEPRED